MERYINCVRIFAAGRDLFDLSETPKAYRLKTAGASFSFLHDILVRLPPVDPSEIPGEPSFDPEKVDSWTYPDTEIVIRRITAGANQGKYIFSAATVSRLPEFHQAIIHLPTVRPTDYPRARQEVYRFTGPLFPFGLTENIPGFLRGNVFGTPLWKVLISLLLAAMIGMLILFWSRLTIGFTSDRGEMVRFCFGVPMKLGFPQRGCWPAWGSAALRCRLRPSPRWKIYLAVSFTTGIPMASWR